MKQLAILGATASGKTDLALTVANKLDGVILSLDSLSIYRGIDIASAKPTKDELKQVKHFGIDVINPDDVFNVTLFFDLYSEAKEYALANDKTLVIVGGTSFYLKAMLTGLSDKPLVCEENKQKVARMLKDIDSTFELIRTIDFEYSQKITNKDTYRMEKWLEIYFETGTIPSQYLKKTLKEPIIKSIPIYELILDRDILRQKIKLRTKQMLDDGLVAEVVGLEKKYGRLPKCMKAIGIKEVLGYLDGYYTLEQMEEKIITNTSKLAKRQRTFNKTQFTQDIKRDQYNILLNYIINL